LAMIHVLIEENLYDDDFTRIWTNGPFLVRSDTQHLLVARELSPSAAADGFVVWDTVSQAPVVCDPAIGYGDTVKPALNGAFSCRVGSTEVVCRPAFAVLKDIAARYAPEQSEAITWVPADMVRRTVRLFATELPSCLFSWAGLEMHSDAMQMNRAVSCFYALTGQFDAAGSNVLTAMTPTRPVAGAELLPKEKAERRLGLAQHPLGPPSDPGSVQAAPVYDAILTGRPYPVRAMVLFGNDPLLSHGDPARGVKALKALDFYVHVDLFANPSAAFADLMLPAATAWEVEALKPSFGGKGGTPEAAAWAQLRKAVVPSCGEARSDLALIFDLAVRLGLGEQFFDADVEAAWNHQLEPSGLTVEQLRANPLGVSAGVRTNHRKYAAADPKNGHPRGFPTPSRRIELYSTRFAAAGYNPLPDYAGPQERDMTGDYPLVLTSFRLRQFVDDQHRNIPRLRGQERDPFIEIHPDTALGLGVVDGEWVTVATAAGKVRLKTRFNNTLHPKVVCAPYGGWWQACRELGLPGHEALDSTGANVNLLIPNALIDPISASVPHRSRMCSVQKAI
jgi:anaerobic selenocysteine-containing dehydrogenase